MSCILIAISKLSFTTQFWDRTPDKDAHTRPYEGPIWDLQLFLFHASAKCYFLEKIINQL